MAHMFAVLQVQEPKVMGQFLAGLQINRGDQREVLLSQVNIHNNTLASLSLHKHLGMKASTYLVSNILSRTVQ